MILFLSTAISIGYYNKNKRQSLLANNTKISFAIYDGNTVVRNSGTISYFYLKLKNRIILIEELGKYGFLSKGDTVLVKYSLEKPDVAKVIDFCYMKKHKGKEYCNCN